MKGVSNRPLLQLIDCLWAMAAVVFVLTLCSVGERGKANEHQRKTTAFGFIGGQP